MQTGIRSPSRVLLRRCPPRAVPTPERLPIGNLPIYLSLTTGNRTADLAIARSCALTVAITLLLADWVGIHLLSLFGISVGAFQAAGGLILLLIGLSMLRSRTSAIHHDPQSAERDADSALRGVVPLGIPLMAGPGTIAMVISSPEVATLEGRAGLSGAILAIAGLVFLILAGAERISAFLSTSTLQILTRIMGLLLSAIAMQMLFSGLGKGFPVLAGEGFGSPRARSAPPGAGESHRFDSPRCHGRSWELRRSSASIRSAWASRACSGIASTPNRPGASAMPHQAILPGDWAAQLASLWQERLARPVVPMPCGAGSSIPPRAPFFRYGRTRRFLRNFSIQELLDRPEDVNEEWISMLRAGGDAVPRAGPLRRARLRHRPHRQGPRGCPRLQAGG